MENFMKTLLVASLMAGVTAIAPLRVVLSEDKSGTNIIANKKDGRILSRIGAIKVIDGSHRRAAIRV
jgi:hypothetical protein